MPFPALEINNMLRNIVTCLSTVGLMLCALEIDGQYLACAGLVLSGFALGGITVITILVPGRK